MRQKNLKLKNSILNQLEMRKMLFAAQMRSAEAGLRGGAELQLINNGRSKKSAPVGMGSLQL